MRAVDVKPIGEAEGTAPADVGAVTAALVNTRAILLGSPHAREDLYSPRALDEWWPRHVGTSWSVPAGQSDLEFVLAVREGLRALFARNNHAETTDDPDAITRFDTVAAALPLRFSPTRLPVPGLRPLITDTASAALADLVGRVAVLAQDRPAWTRLKVCRDPHCREAFRDTTRSRTRTWCSMEVCGARAKQRTFAARQRGGG